MRKLLLLLLLIPFLANAQKISTLTDASTLDGSEKFHAIQAGHSRAISINQIRSFMTVSFVPLNRVLTINGVSLDLSQNRSWTVSGGGGSSAWVDITGKPTTLAGYGIIDAPLTTYVDSQLAGKQAVDTDLNAIASVTHSGGDFLTDVGGNWVGRTTAQIKTILGINNVDNTSDINKSLSNAEVTALGLKSDKTDFQTLTFASTTDWSGGLNQLTLAKVTATGSFALNMTSIKSGSEGWLKLTTNTASAITITFDTDYTNKTTGGLGEEIKTTYTFQASNGKEYLLKFIADGTVLHWTIYDFGLDVNADPSVSLRVASISWPNATTQAVVWTSEDADNTNIYNIAVNPSRLPIPGVGNKWVTVSGYGDFAANATNIRRIWLYLNGVAASGIGINYFQLNGSSTNSTTIGYMFQIPCQGGDYLEIVPFQNSGSALNFVGSVQYKVESR